MENGKKAALIFSMVGVLAIGGEILYLHHRNNEEAPVKKASGETFKLTDDFAVAVNLKKLRPDSLKDVRELIGKTVWVSAGGQLDYYKDTGKHVDYMKPAGALLGAEPLVIKEVFEQVPPAKATRAVARIPVGQRHVLVGFTMPKSADPNTVYATPVGHFEGGVYDILNDQIFYYDDPHELYKHWSADAWAHIDKHEVVPGMSENQAMMAYGQVLKFGGDTPGDRTIHFENNGHPMKVVFVHDKATSVTPEDSF